jgi:hypothetical protein
MNNVPPTPSSIVILFDPSDIHTTLDEEEYYAFHRFTTFDNVLNLINTGQCGRIDLHLPTNFDFNLIRPNRYVYIHAYFRDNEDTSITNQEERQKIRDSIRTCCEINGEEFIERGILEANDRIYDEGIDLAEQLLQLDIDLMNTRPP